jgi:hypothetical protein
VADLLCLEPGLGDGKLWVVYAKATDRLVYPDVDTCMTVTFLLSTGEMIGGHAAMQAPGDDPSAFPKASRSLAAIVVKMLEIKALCSSGSKLQRAIFCGEFNKTLMSDMSKIGAEEGTAARKMYDWKANKLFAPLGQIDPTFKPQFSLLNTTWHAPVDIFADGPRKRFVVQKHAKHTVPSATGVPPLGTPVYDEAFSALPFDHIIKK